ncbi:MAG TPA: hypothetical protein ENF58_02695 [Candidatus Altiarchaeales archaeon]|nr:hypothetical protein [Candidatus Altiarchaeales archaeon]
MRKINKKLIMGVCICIILIPSITSEWFGEMAVKHEAIELKFRGIFILLIYYLLHGTFIGKPVGHGLLEIFDSLRDLILMNPPLDDHLINHIIEYFITVLEPLYVMAILITGIYLMFLSGSPKGRRKAKLLFPKLIASMVIVSLTFPILQLISNVSYELSKDILDKSPVGIGRIFLDTINDLVRIFTASTLTTFEGGHLFLLFIFFMIIGIFSVLTLRYLLLLIFTLIFPIGIFLYTFNITRDIGRFIVEQTILWTFLQVIIALLIVTANMGITILGFSGDLRTIIGISTFLMVIISPIMLITMVRRFLP